MRVAVLHRTRRQRWRHRTREKGDAYFSFAPPPAGWHGAGPILPTRDGACDTQAHSGHHGTANPVHFKSRISAPARSDVGPL